MKLPKFLEAETREEFKRKMAEFQSYADRTNLEAEEIADDLYLNFHTSQEETVGFQ